MADETTDTTATETSTETTGTETTTEQQTAAAETDTSLMSEVGKAEGGEQQEASEAGEGETAEEGTEGKPDEPVVPEAYELAAPEGFEITPELTAEATPVFKDLGLTNEQANKLMPLAGKFAEKLQGAQADAFAATAADWAKESQAAPDIGGSKWKETEANVARFFAVAETRLPPVPVLKDGKPLIENGKPVMMSGKDQVQSFRDLLGDSKLGNHPTMIRMFNLVGAQVGEDNNFVRSDTGTRVEKSREEVWYPNMTQNKD